MLIHPAVEGTLAAVIFGYLAFGERLVDRLVSPSEENEALLALVEDGGERAGDAK